MMFSSMWASVSSASVHLMSVLLVLYFLLCAIKYIWNIYHNMQYDKTFQAPLPDGNMGWPIIGETIQLILKGSNFYEERFQKHGKLFKTHILGKPVIRVYGAENLQKIFQLENEILSPSLPHSTRSLLGEHALSSAFGARHTTMRKRALTAFRHSALASYVSSIQTQIDETLEDWCAREFVLVYPEMGELIFRVGGVTLCGFNYSKKDIMSLTKTFKVFMDNIFSLPINIPGSGLNKGMKARKILLERIETSIRSKRDTDSSEDQNALRFLMECLDDTTDYDQIKDLALELLFASFATTSSAATTLVLNLSRNPEVVARIKEELKESALHSSDDSLQLKLKDIHNLKYVSAVVTETLRITPPVGGGFRKVLQTFTLEGKQIPKDWTLVWSIRETMAYSSYYTNTHEFNPDRFMTDDKDEKFTQNRYNYCVFGGGPRSCIGKQFAILFLKVFTIELIRKCSWGIQAEDKLKMGFLPVPHPKNGLPVKFMPNLSPF
ncbi:cytochrome P450 26B1-like [Anneissia japonica]|uniref:cytochrome P450 26B1-like n=1 Tax=Anneissia japonica TaxID=1529436 RepID=UPI001425A19F|nr:cytochrome P450 26B1-like [Anneissia japonica]